MLMKYLLGLDGIHVYAAIAVIVYHILITVFAPSIWLTFGTIAFTLVLAEVSYRWYEKPFLRLKDRFGAHSVGAVSAIN